MQQLLLEGMGVLVCVGFIQFSLLQLEEKKKLCATDEDMETLQKRINDITTAQDDLRKPLGYN